MADSDYPVEKFAHPLVTAKGEQRAHVPYERTKTLWFNTGTLCNIECVNCYIESSPTNDRLVYLTVADVAPYLDELDAAGESGCEVGFTGGEPFMAPEFLDILELVLERGFSALVLTNAMQPMMRPRVKGRLIDLNQRFAGQLIMRVSLDHYTAKFHDEERGKGAFDKTLQGLAWLAVNDFSVALAGRTMWSEEDALSRDGYQALCNEIGLKLDTADPKQLILFPEMTDQTEPPEITTACWNILNVSTSDQMCATQRMVVRRKGRDQASVVACTLLPYDEQFELGNTLSDARRDVALNHPYCASFCVLGGGSCSA